MRISIAKVKDLVGGCQTGKKINPKKLKRGKYVRNLPSVNNECFYSCIAHFFTQSQRLVDLEKFIDNHISKTEEGAMPVNRIAHFEKKNHHLNIRINVVVCSKSGVLYPVYNSKNRSAKNRISLLLHFVKHKIDTMGHYMVITDFNKYASFNYSKEKIKLDDGSQFKKVNVTRYLEGFYCHNCLLRFKRKKTFEEHVELCSANETQRIVIPREGASTKFNCFRKTVPLPFVGFCDFEAQMEEIEYCNICDDYRSCTHNSTYLNQHKAFAFSLVIFDRFNTPVVQKTYAGSDCVEQLLNCLFDNADILEETFLQNVPAECTEAEFENYELSTECGICGESIGEDDIKVFHHEHYTGKCKQFNLCLSTISYIITPSLLCFRYLSRSSKL